MKDEEKVLKYALRISELEYTCSKKNTGKSFDQIKPSQTFNATEIDFLEPLKYIDSLWNEDSNTGVLKIIPPKQWVAYQQGAHLNRIVSHYYGEESNSLPARSQKLSKLYEAKVK